MSGPQTRRHVLSTHSHVLGAPRRMGDRSVMTGISILCSHLVNQFDFEAPANSDQ